MSFTGSFPAIDLKDSRSQIIPGADHPILRLDLRSAGYTGFEPKQEPRDLLALRPNPICFSEKNVLIATFITREDVTTLARRDQPGEVRPLRLHGIFLDIGAGKVQASKEWPITRPHGGIIAAGDGRFVVLTPEMIALYSPSLELVKDFKLSSDQQSHLSNFRSSPSGNTILIIYHHYPERPNFYFQWIDIGSLQPQPAWEAILPGFSISDNELTFERTTYKASQHILVVEDLIRPRDGPERTLCRAVLGHGDHCGPPFFLSNDLLALGGGPHDLAVVAKASGDVLFKDKFPEDEQVAGIFPSADGKRFAVTISEDKPGNPLLDTYPHDFLKRIVVYDIQAGKAVYALDVRKRKLNWFHSIALSPDGSLLALLVDGIVEVYQIPPSV